MNVCVYILRQQMLDTRIRILLEKQQYLEIKLSSLGLTYIHIFTFAHTLVYILRYQLLL